MMVATAARLVGGTKQAIAFAKRRHALWKVRRFQLPSCTRTYRRYCMAVATETYLHAWSPRPRSTCRVFSLESAADDALAPLMQAQRPSVAKIGPMAAPKRGTRGQIYEEVGSFGHLPLCIFCKSQRWHHVFKLISMAYSLKLRDYLKLELSYF